MPESSTEAGLFGLLKTLKKSTLNRNSAVSVSLIDLMSDASANHCRFAGIAWFRQGCMLSLKLSRCGCATPVSGIHTLLVFQNEAIFVFAGAFGGSVVEPYGIRYSPAGL